MERYLKHIASTLFLFFIFFIGSCFGRFMGKKSFRDDMQRDTVINYISYDFAKNALKPLTLDYQPLQLEMVLIPYDSIEVVVQKDIRYISLPREYRYTKTDKAEVWFSGVNPSIDSLVVHSPVVTEYVRESMKRNELSLNVSSGYMSGFRTSAGVRYTYRFNKWLDASVEGGYDFINGQGYGLARLTATCFRW